MYGQGAAQRTCEAPEWIIDLRLCAPPRPYCFHRCIIFINNSFCCESFCASCLGLLLLLLFSGTTLAFELGSTLLAVCFLHGLLRPLLRRCLRGGHLVSMRTCICLASDSC